MQPRTPEPEIAILNRSTSQEHGRAGPVRVRKLQSIRLRTGTARWRFATIHSAAIEAHWLQLTKAKPALFNGPLHLIGEYDTEQHGFRARMVRTDYKSFLYWRDCGYPLSAGVRGTGVSAVLRSSDGGLILGEAAAHTALAGAVYLLSGVIDDNDVSADGSIDVGAAAMRELREETGLEPSVVTRMPGFWMIADPAWYTFGIELVSPLTAAALAEHFRAFLAANPGHELAGIRIVFSAAEAERLGAMSHTMALARVLFG